MSLRGIPDYLGCVRGRFVALELKIETGRPAKLQEFIIDKINSAGGYARVVYPSTFDQVLEEIKCL